MLQDRRLHRIHLMKYAFQFMRLLLHIYEIVTLSCTLLRAVESYCRKSCAKVVLAREFPSFRNLRLRVRSIISGNVSQVAAERKYIRNTCSRRNVVVVVVAMCILFKAARQSLLRDNRTMSCSCYHSPSSPSIRNH